MENSRIHELDSESLKLGDESLLPLREDNDSNNSFIDSVEDTRIDKDRKD